MSRYARDHFLFRLTKTLLSGQVPPPGMFPEWMLDGAARLCSARSGLTPLSNIERVVTALRHKEPDHIPCCPLVISASRRLVGASFPEFAQNPRIAADALLAGLEFAGGEIVVPMLDLSVEAADFGQKMIYPADSTPHPDYSDPLIRDVVDYRKLKRIDLRDARRMVTIVELCRILVKEVGFRGAVSGFCFGPLGVLNMMRGAEHLFRDCMNHPREVMAALETITDVLIEYVEAQCDEGVLAVTLDTLFASWNGLSREMWERIEAPFVREIARAVRQKGCLVAVHNCGHGVYFDSQIRCMEPSIISFAHLPDDCHDRKELKNRYGDQVVLMGMVETPLLGYGSPFDVMQECRRMIDDLADGGGFILAPGCEYPPNLPMDNALAIAMAARNYG